MEKNNLEKLQDLCKDIQTEFPKISLKNIVNLEDFIKKEKVDEKIIKELSFFLLDYDKKSIDNNTKYGFPETDFEDYKDRDLFLCRTYKAIINKLEEQKAEPELIKKYVRLGAQKVHDRKAPYRCLELGRLDYKDTSIFFKDYTLFYSEKIKEYDKSFRFIESENTKAYISNKKTRKENIIKFLLVIAIVIIVFFAGRFLGNIATNFIDKDSTKNEVEDRIIETI